MPRTGVRRQGVRGPGRVVGLPQPKGAGGLRPNATEHSFPSAPRHPNRAEAVMVKSRGAERRIASANCVIPRPGTASER